MQDERKEEADRVMLAMSPNPDSFVSKGSVNVDARDLEHMGKPKRTNVLRQSRLLTCVGGFPSLRATKTKTVCWVTVRNSQLVACTMFELWFREP